MGNNCMKTSNGLQIDDIRYSENNSRNTYKSFQTEKQRRQYYLNMNSEAAEEDVINNQ